MRRPSSFEPRTAGSTLFRGPDSVRPTRRSFGSGRRHSAPYPRPSKYVLQVTTCSRQRGSPSKSKADRGGLTQTSRCGPSPRPTARLSSCRHGAGSPGRISGSRPETQGAWSSRPQRAARARSGVPGQVPQLDDQEKIPAQPSFVPTRRSD